MLKGKKRKEVATTKRKKYVDTGGNIMCSKEQ